MSIARVRIVQAGPYSSIQDAGRPGHLRHGVSPSGPMDRIAHAVANVAVGNGASAAAIEVSAGGAGFESNVDLTVAITGGTFDVSTGDRRVESWSVVTLPAGERLTVRAGSSGNWAYLAVAGEIRCERWLGSASTHVPSGFGGGVLSAGDVVEVESPRARPDLDGPLEPTGSSNITSVRFVPGPQGHRFASAALAHLTDQLFWTTAAFDRMGVRLDGPPLDLVDALSIPSEAIVRGSVQVAGDGVATVLLADHQTTGGYPKIATVIDADVDRVAQLQPGSPLRFVPIVAAEGVDAARQHRIEVDAAIAAAARTDRTLEQRLRRRNLVDGIVDASGSEAEPEWHQDPSAVEPEP